MKIHEFQAKEILARQGVRVPKGILASSPEQVRKIAEQLGGRVVVKAQIHAGGRGKGGGVRVVKDPQAAEEAARAILDKPLVTHQTGPEGQIVRKILVEEALGIERELYAGLVVDRERASIAFILSSAGGMEIEEVARKNPEKILQEVIDPLNGLMPFQIRNLAYQLELKKPQVENLTTLVTAMYQAFVQTDASLIEINPLVVLTDGELVALDAKMNFDDNALFRNPNILALRDLDEEDPAEIEASKYDLSYIKLDGNIGCMVNGAGLAMATMDIIKLQGGEPANFLDVGGGTDQKRVKSAFKILLSDKKVRAVLVNIFGGIVRCDVIAEGMVAAAKEIGIHVPLVVRLQGTKVDEGREILNRSGLNIVSVDGMQEAAEKVVQAAGRKS